MFLTQTVTSQIEIWRGTEEFAGALFPDPPLVATGLCLAKEVTDQNCS